MFAAANPGFEGPSGPTQAGVEERAVPLLQPAPESCRVEAGVVAQVEEEVTTQTAVGFQRPPATAGRIPFVEAFP